MMLGAMLALVLVAAAPAIAQVSEGFSERRITSGAASPKTEISNKGNNVNLCPTGQQVTQTGNVANEQGTTQYQTKTDDIGFSGSEITLTPSETAECTQTIEQAAAAGPKAEAKAELPKTGGVAGTASLLGLGAGALLVAGGLLARRIIR